MTAVRIAIGGILRSHRCDSLELYMYSSEWNRETISNRNLETDQKRIYSTSMVAIFNNNYIQTSLILRNFIQS
jgi:hypothetical protein